VDLCRINGIVHGKRSITAFRLGVYFGITSEFWLNAQSHYDLEHLTQEAGAAIKREGKARNA
jgi:plasmid maintenance system antidote protein VapI